MKVSTDRKTEKSKDVPVSGLDWLKLLLVTWQPTLRFGWLIPRTQAIAVEVTQNDTYYNVYPLTWEYPELDSVELAFPEKIDWLTAVPATKAEVYDAMDEIHQWQSSMEYYTIPGINPQAVSLFLNYTGRGDRS
jgi:hypothetical protein